MIGYLKSKPKVFQEDPIREALKQAVASSGGSSQHYNIFDNLLSHSLRSQQTQMPFHDTRAAQSLLFLYPVKIQVFLSLLLYKEEVMIYNTYIDNYDITDNILLPSTVLFNNSIVTKRYLSSSLSNLLSFVDKDLIISDDHLAPVTEFFSVNKSINSLNTNLATAIANLFDIFNITREYNETFIQIAVTNNRVQAASILAQSLSYKPKSVSNLISVTNRWLNLTSNT